MCELLHGVHVECASCEYDGLHWKVHTMRWSVILRFSSVWVYTLPVEAAYDSNEISNILSLRVCIWFLIIINTFNIFGAHFVLVRSAVVRLETNHEERVVFFCFHFVLLCTRVYFTGHSSLPTAQVRAPSKKLLLDGVRFEAQGCRITHSRVPVKVISFYNCSLWFHT